ncbi:putative nucleotide-diphospho-sugar transferase [Yoonia algicola]|uniref:Nucleotide-diphospho-sugar transferase n=1 Tax=Yoonia algicola TaxID=3137368 RepID=A0AAN0M2Z0_9RHOB
MTDGPYKSNEVAEIATPVCGVNYICTGATFTKAGVNSARSVRMHSPNLQIDIYTDSPSEIPDGIFDMVHLIADPHRRSKVDYMAKTRFDRSLYLDTDTRVVKDISNMFDLLDRFDLAIAHAHERQKKSNLEGWRCHIPDNFPQMNSGVMVYRRTPVVMEMLSDWQAAFHTADFNKDQVTLRELLWLSDLRIYILPPEYNVRYAKYIKVWTPSEAEPKILHFASFHHEVGIIQGLRGWRRQLRKLKNAYRDVKKA